MGFIGTLSDTAASTPQALHFRDETEKHCNDKYHHRAPDPENVFLTQLCEGRATKTIASEANYQLPLKLQCGRRLKSVESRL